MQLYTQQEYNDSKLKDWLPVRCDFCQKQINKQKKIIQTSHRKYQGKDFCSPKCSSLYNNETKGWGTKTIRCVNCGKIIVRDNNQIARVKNSFCSRSCAATYNNTHKTHGTRRSKLEVWLEKELTKLYPNLEIHYNRKDAIDSELDIHIPNLKLAFELNGIFHYEPIFGQDKLEQTQNNDDRKFQACLEQEISLCIIDVSQLSYFKPKKAQKYLDIIIKIINGAN